jgi:hypothetical protein
MAKLWTYVQAPKASATQNTPALCALAISQSGTGTGACRLSVLAE